MNTKEYLITKTGDTPGTEGCPGDWGLDCPVKQWGVDCPKIAHDCWEENLTERNKQYIDNRSDCIKETP